ncbi:MAG: ABC transporter permease, partial [Desulfobacula sp.]|nr:ABC transporter permease [Desulfobacula sp.]
MKNVLMLIFKRTGASLVTVFIISLIIFIGVEALPGDVAETVLGQGATAETVEAFRKELKLDLPPHIRYIAWLNDFVHGEFGNSLANGRPVAGLIGWRFGNTLFLALSTAVVAIPLAILLGMLAAFYRNTFFDKLISTTTLSFISFPEFFIAYILISLFSVKFNIFPSLAVIDPDMGLGSRIYA